MFVFAQVVEWLASGRLIKAVIAIWLIFVGVTILLPYHAYFPPQFTRGFLLGRESYFYGIYAVGFYAHITTAPLVLLIGIIQCSRTFRRTFLRLHRRLGQIYCVLILCAMAPGGLVLALRAYGGWPAVLAFSLLSLLTWWFTYRGWQSIHRWDQAAHGRWMHRSFLLVCSAILLRVLSIEASHWQLDPETAYAAIAWLCWLPAWLTYEAFLKLQARSSL